MVESALKVGDRVMLIAETLAWRAEITLQGQIGEIIERREDGGSRSALTMADFSWPESLNPLSSCREMKPAGRVWTPYEDERFERWLCQVHVLPRSQDR